jgi:magnesium transporter
MEDTSLDELSTIMADNSCGWIDIFQPEEDVTREFLEGEMNFHHLAVDDCFEEPASRVFVYDVHKFTTFKARDADRELDTEYLRAFLKDGWLITVRHAHMPGIAEFRKRIKSKDFNKGEEMKSEYLLYQLLDSVADDWTKVLISKSERLDEIEDQVFDPNQVYPNLLENLHEMKGDLREIAKSTTPLDELVQQILRSDEGFVTDETELYYRDLADLTHSIGTRLENYSSGAASTRDTYISQTSMRLAESQAETAEVMRLLTIIATIMLPITAVASIFGMNVHSFGAGNGPVDLMTILAVMGAIGCSMLLWLYMKGYIGKR